MGEIVLSPFCKVLVIIAIICIFFSIGAYKEYALHRKEEMVEKNKINKDK